jgi:hypothetical protein
LAWLARRSSITAQPVHLGHIQVERVMQLDRVSLRTSHDPGVGRADLAVNTGLGMTQFSNPSISS